MKWLLLIALVAGIVSLTILNRHRLRALVSPIVQKLSTPRTVNDRLKQYGDSARARMKPYFEKQRLPYPPNRAILIGLKSEKILEVYACGADQRFSMVRRYPILAASGTVGPKLREGDRQVPEGIYPIESLNPNSRFHLSLRLGYPNAFDREQAAREGRTNPGGDIMIHGSAVSIGCLAMGDSVAEELFVLAADTGLTNVSVILSPVDFRQRKHAPVSGREPPWTANLHESIRVALEELPVEP